MEQRVIAVLSGALGLRAGLDLLESLGLLDLACLDWLVLLVRSVYLVRLEQQDPRVIWDHLELPVFLDPLASQVPLASSWVVRRAVQTSSVH